MFYPIDQGPPTGDAAINTWKERLSVALTGQLRMDPTKFKALFPGTEYKCELPKSGSHFGVKGNPSLWPYWYHSGLAQAALFQAWSNDKSPCGYTAHDTCKDYIGMFGGKNDFDVRVKAIADHQVPTHQNYGENALSGRPDPVVAIQAWLSSEGHCSTMFSNKMNLMGAGVSGGSWIHVMMVAYEMPDTGCTNDATWKDSYGDGCGEWDGGRGWGRTPRLYVLIHVLCCLCYCCCCCCRCCFCCSIHRRDLSLFIKCGVSVPSPFHLCTTPLLDG